MIRKRLFHTLSLALVVVAGALLGGCDDDVMQAQKLSGRWHGEWASFVEVPDRGRVVTYSCYNTQLEFYPDNGFSSRGTGRQIDYFEYGPYECLYYRFTWSIKNGVVTLRYPGGATFLNTDIIEYHMSDREFYGRFEGSRSRFRMYKYDEVLDWDRYSGDYWYDPRENSSPYYHAPALERGAEPDSAAAPADSFPEER